MATEPNVVGEIAPAPSPTVTTTPTDAAVPASPPKAKLTKALPSERMSFEKSLVVLRCFAIGAGTENKAVSNAQLADLTKLNESTAGVNNVFYAQAGLITKVGNGYTPSPEVVRFEGAYQFNQETAGQKLAPALRRSWFGAALLPKLAVRPVSEDEALGELAEACRGQPEHKPQLRALLDYLATATVIERDGGMIRQGRLARDDGQPPRPEDTTVTPQPQLTVTTPGAPQTTQRVQTTFAGGSTAGGISLAVNIDVNYAEMATWPPQTVTAFLTGLAQVINAKAAAESAASGAAR